MEFNADTFMLALRKKLPGATLSCKTRTEDEKSVMLENLRAKPKQQPIKPMLGAR